MPWQSYEVIFRLQTPVHIGWGEVSNLLRTRLYVTGRVLWGALTMRLTRDMIALPTAHDYQHIGKEVHQSLAVTYFYPAIANDEGYQIAWPWEDSANFRYRFLSSYASTALSYPQQSAATGMLHEVECIVPHTIDCGKAVFLIGYIFVADICTLPWQVACQRLQIGGERGYGWGDLKLIRCCKSDAPLFDGQAVFDGSNERPALQLMAGQSLLAHMHASGAQVDGVLEPVVGREWRRHPGQYVAHSGICFVPGSKLQTNTHVVIEDFGIWRAL